MKKFLGILALVFLLNGCDDGDVTVDTVSFDEVDANSCGLLVYKLTDNQAMIIKLPDGTSSVTDVFTNDATPVGTPTILTVGVDASVIYRTYNGTVTTGAICNSPAPISPAATQEWIASQGKIEIATIPVYSDPDSETGATKITKYRHTITFREIKFSKPDGTDQNYSEFVFGNFYTTPTALDFDFEPDQVALCPATNTLYNAKNAGDEALFIQNFSPSLLSNDLGVKTALIGNTENIVIYRLLATPLTAGANENYFCSGTTVLPATEEQWNALPGVDGVSGIIEVTTTTNGSGRLHTIHLKGVTFKKGNSTFYYGDDIPYGELITN